MRIELVTIGDELLLGFTVDSNGAHIARELAGLGARVVRRATVGDDGEAIAAAVREALDRTGAVITTGGLGPTADDLTKPAIAALFGKGMRLDEPLLETLRRRWIARGWGKELPESNRLQAMVPEDAVLLTNRHGAAPGIWLEDDRGRWVAMLPGVPREMKGMLAEELLPRIRARVAVASGDAVPVVASRTVRTTGIAESALADRMAQAVARLEGVSLAYLPGWEGVDLRVTCAGQPAGIATTRLAAAAAVLREVAGPHAYGDAGDDLAAVVLGGCRARGWTVAVAESCTGGLIGGRLTAIPGSSDVFLGGIIAYANEVKATHLGVGDDTLIAHGAVSEETAREMATNARARFRSDVAIAVTGIAGPGGGTEDKPVGTVCVAVATAHAVQSARRVMLGDRQEIRLRTTQWALDLVRRACA